MRKRFRKFAVIVSLTLCVAMVGLWVASCRWRAAISWDVDRISPDFEHDVYGFDSMSGRLRFYTLHRIGMPNVPKRPISTFEPLPEPQLRDLFWQTAHARVHLGIGRWYRSNYATYEVKERHDIDVNYWFLVLVTAILPLRAWWVRRRFAAGCCPACGYDLRATPDRCPECGTVPRAGKSAASETSPPAGG